MDSKEETFQEIRDRRIKEFEAKLMTGTPIPCESVLPWYINKIDELKAQVKKLQKEVDWWEQHA
jgi:hypothetical protein